MLSQILNNIQAAKPTKFYKLKEAIKEKIQSFTV